MNRFALHYREDSAMSHWPQALATQLVGSYTKPSWLLRKHGESWRADPEVLADAQDDAVRLAIYDQERAGLDLLSDGEGRRLNFARHFAIGWQGVDALNMVKLTNQRRGVTTEYPRVIGPIELSQPRVLDDLRFLKAASDRPVKMTVVGPLTAARRLADEYYRDDKALLLACAGAINAELRALQAEGCDLLQLDEPVLYTNPGPLLPYASEALERALEGITTPVAVHVCYGYAYRFPNKQADPAYAAALEILAACRQVQWISIEYAQPKHSPELLKHCGDKAVILGVLDLATENIETPHAIADRARAASEFVSPNRLNLAPDCGMWHLPRPVAFAKLRALVQGAEIVIRELNLTA